MGVRVTRKRIVQAKVVEPSSPGEGPFTTMKRRVGTPGHYAIFGKPDHFVPASMVGPDEKVKVTGWEHTSSGWWAKKVKKA